MADFKDLTNEMKKTNQKVDDLSKAVKDSSAQDTQNTTKLTQGMGEIIKNDVGGGIKDLAGTITAPLTSFAKAIPGVSTMGKIAGQLGKNAVASAKQVEKDREQARRENKSNTVLEGIYNGILDLKDSFLKGVQKASGMSLGVVAGMIAAPVITLVNFFKSLGTELKFLNKLTGGRLTNLFKPIVRLFDGISDIIAKGGTGRILKGDTFKVFGRFTNFVRRIIEGPIKLFGRISKAFAKFPIVVNSFTRMFRPIAKFAAGFGRILGRVFLPITIVMSLWDAITGAIDGFMSSDNETMAGKFVDGIGGGIAKLISNIVGFPLNLLKSGVAWIGEQFGFDMSGLKDLDFVSLISDMIMYPFNLISDAVDWIGTLFTDPTAALQQLWNGIVGEGGLLDLIFKPIDLAVNWVMGIFGWSSEDGTDFSFKGFVFGLIDTAINWVKGIFSWAESTPEEGEGGWTLMGSILEAIKAPIRFVKNLFTFSDEDMNAKGMFTKLIDLVYAPLNIAINFVRGLFGWDTDEDGNKTEFSLGTLITDTVSKIWNWFKGLLDIDVMKIVESIPGASTLLSWFQSDAQDQAMAAATESGLYTKKGIGRNSQIDRGMVAGASTEQLEAILADDDLSNEDNKFIAAEIERRRNQGGDPNKIHFGRLSDGQFYYFKMRDGQINVLDDQQRAEQMYNAQDNLDESRFDGSGGNTTIVKGGDTINQSQTPGTGYVPVSVEDRDSNKWNGTSD